MKSRVTRALLLTIATVAILCSAAVVRTRLQITLRQRLAQEYQQTLAGLSDQSACELLHQLAQDDVSWLTVLIGACADSRPSVAEVARSELRDAVRRWADLSPAESTPLAVDAAEQLARLAPQLAIDQRDWAIALAERLMNWPLAGGRANVAQHIANCETVLLMPRAERLEVRIATNRDATRSEPVLPKLPDPTPAPVLSPTQALPPPLNIIPTEPRPLEIRDPEQAVEPKRFLPPLRKRIADE